MSKTILVSLVFSLGGIVLESLSGSLFSRKKKKLN